MIKSCLMCIHSEVCKFYAGELLKHDYSEKDFIQEIDKIRKDLSSDCPDFIERTKSK